MEQLIETVLKTLGPAAAPTAVLIWVMLDMRAERKRLADRLDKITDALLGGKVDTDGDGKPG